MYCLNLKECILKFLPKTSLNTNSRIILTITGRKSYSVKSKLLCIIYIYQFTCKIKLTTNTIRYENQYIIILYSESTIFLFFGFSFIYIMRTYNINFTLQNIGLHKYKCRSNIDIHSYIV